MYVAAEEGVSFMLKNPIAAGSFGELALNIIDGLITILIPFMVLAVVWTGASLVFSAGKPEAIAKHRQNLLWAIIGVFIVLAAKGILTVVQTTVESIKEGSSVATLQQTKKSTTEDAYV